MSFGRILLEECIIQRETLWTITQHILLYPKQPTQSWQRKTKAGGIALSNFQLRHKYGNWTMWYWYKRHQSVILYKSTKIHNREIIIFSIISPTLGKLDIHIQKNNERQYWPHTMHKNELKMDYRLEHKTVKLLGENGTLTMVLAMTFYFIQKAKKQNQK